MKRIALTGGIACGKSLVARHLNELGVETIDADDIVHELIPDPAERKRIAAEVFSDSEKRRELEARIHPLVKKRIDEFLVASDLRSTPSIRIAVVPLLFETHWDRDYDIICTVVSGPEVQISRMTANRGYSLDEAERRMAAQIPVSEKAARSHYVIRNDGSEQDLRVEVEKFVCWLKSQVQQ